MKRTYFVTSILFLVTMVISILVTGQFKTVSVIAPPEIKLSPLPARVVIFHDLPGNESAVPREKKDDLIRECTDSLMLAFKSSISMELSTVEFILVPAAEIGDSLRTPFSLLRDSQADLALGIADFRPEVRQGEVSTTEDEDNGKSKSASYYMVARGALHIYNRDSLVRTFSFSESRYLQDRSVMSGLLALGPSLVKHRAAALAVTNDAAQQLAEKFVPQSPSYSLILFDKKELKEVTDLITQNNYQEALQKALELTTHEDEAISSRACYLCALLYHMQMDFTKAFEYAKRAREIKKLIGKEGWTSYYYFLKKYAVDNEVAWKEQ